MFWFLASVCFNVVCFFRRKSPESIVNSIVEEPLQQPPRHTPVVAIYTNREVESMIAVDMLGWSYSSSSDTYWLEFGVQMGAASSFRPLSDKDQGNTVISELNLPCTLENLKQYVLSLSNDQRRAYGREYGPRQRRQSGIKYYSIARNPEGKVVRDENGKLKWEQVMA